MWAKIGDSWEGSFGTWMLHHATPVNPLAKDEPFSSLFLNPFEPLFLRITSLCGSLCHLKHLWTAGLQHQRVWWRTGEQSLSVALREVSTGREGDGWCFWPSTDSMGSRLVQLKLWVFSNRNQLKVWLFLAQTCWDTPNFIQNRSEKETYASSFQLKESHVQSLGMFLGCVHTGRKHQCRLRVKFVKSDSPEVLDTTINDQRRILARWVISICLRCPPWPSGPYLSLDVSDPVTIDLWFIYPGSTVIGAYHFKQFTGKLVSVNGFWSVFFNTCILKQISYEFWRNQISRTLAFGCNYIETWLDNVFFGATVLEYSIWCVDYITYCHGPIFRQCFVCFTQNYHH